MKIVAQMDEISSINIKTDSTFAILLEAQNRGHEIFYYLPSELNFEVKSETLFALVKKIKLKNELGNHFEILDKKQENLVNFDVILVRQDPPFDMNYITSTYLLEKIKNQVLILNDPSEIRNSSEKIFATDFPDLSPPTLISSGIENVREFREVHGDIILKPLYARGGEGVVLIKKDDLNFNSIFELLFKTYQTPLLAQKFIPEIKDGDKRIILLNGEVVGGIARIAKGDIRSNLHIGGYAAKLELSARDLEICRIIAPELKKRKLFFVGIDVIGDYLTEINVTSPTCIRELNELDGICVEEMVVRAIEDWKI
jgi:glutathione synthase